MINTLYDCPASSVHRQVQIQSRLGILYKTVAFILKIKKFMLKVKGQLADYFQSFRKGKQNVKP